MALTPTLISSGVVSIIFGILVLIFPRFLRYFVGIYLIVIGALQFLPAF